MNQKNRLNYRRRRRRNNKPERQKAKKHIAGELRKLTVPSTNVRELLWQLAHEPVPCHLTT